MRGVERYPGRCDVATAVRPQQQRVWKAAFELRVRSPTCLGQPRERPTALMPVHVVVVIGYAIRPPVGRIPSELSNDPWSVFVVS